MTVASKGANKKAPLALFLMLLIAMYYFGKFSERFEINLCYSDAISYLLDESVYMATHVDQPATERYKMLADTLPLHGYETSCDEVTMAIDHYKQAKNRQ